MKNYGKKAFEKAFAKAVPNFDETKIFFSHPSRGHEESTIMFVWKGKLAKFKMYRSDYELNIWKNHFIEFLNIEEFDYNGYWKLYRSESIPGQPYGLKQIFVDDKVYKFPMCKNLGSDFSVHSPEINEFYKSPEGSKVGKELGMTLVPKPN